MTIGPQAAGAAEARQRLYVVARLARDEWDESGGDTLDVEWMLDALLDPANRAYLLAAMGGSQDVFNPRRWYFDLTTVTKDAE